MTLATAPVMSAANLPAIAGLPDFPPPPENRPYWVYLHLLCSDVGHPRNQGAEKHLAGQATWGRRKLVWDEFVWRYFDMRLDPKRKLRGAMRKDVQAEAALWVAVVRLLERMAARDAIPDGHPVPLAFINILLEARLVCFCMARSSEAREEWKGVTRWKRACQAQNAALRSLDHEARLFEGTYTGKVVSAAMTLAEAGNQVRRGEGNFYKEFYRPMVAARIAALQVQVEQHPVLLIKNRVQLQGVRPRSKKTSL